MNTRSWKLVLLVILVIGFIYINYSGITHPEAPGIGRFFGIVAVDLFVILGLILVGPKQIFKDYFS